MNLVDVSVKRPTFITMVIMALILLGLMAFKSLPIDLYPRMDFPVVAVTATYRGAAPEEIESLITKPLEDQVSTLSGVKTISAYASEGVSTVIIQFNMDVPIRKAAEDVREKVAAVRAILPREVDAPIVQTFDPNSEPLVYFGLSGDTSSQLSDYVDKVLKPRLERVDGVGRVQVFGEQLPEAQIRLSADKLAAFNVPLDNVLGTLRAANQDTPGGNLQSSTSQQSLRLTGRLKTLESVGDLYVPSAGGSPVQLKDIAEIAIGQQEGNTRAILNGRQGLILGVTKQSDANTVAVAEAVKHEVQVFQKELPAHYQLKPTRDDSLFIEESVNELQETILVGALLAVAIVFFFLRDWRATIIAAIAIPVSLLFTFAVMKLLGFTINMMSMMALSLSVGLLIDDAIVVVDNIYRHLEMGKSPIQAALEGTKEISLAVVAVTLTLVAVFVPIGFASGIVGRFMSQFAFTVAAAVLASLFVALTLTPMLASRFLKRPVHGEAAGKGVWARFNRRWEAVYGQFEGAYRATLKLALTHRWKTLGIAGLAFVASLGSVPFLGSEFAPKNDQGLFMINVKTTTGTSLEGTEKLTRTVLDKLKTYPQIDSATATIGNTTSNASNEASVMIQMKPREKAGMHTYEFQAMLRPFLSSVPGAELRIGEIAMAGSDPNSAPITLKFMGSDLETLDRVTSDLVEKIRHVKGAVDVRDNLDTGRPELSIIPSRDLLATTGVSEQIVMSTLKAMVGGEKVGDYPINGKDRDLRVRLAERDRDTSGAIGALTVSTANGPMAVRDLVQLRPGNGPVQINRESRLRTVSIMANVQDRSLGEVTKDVTALLEKTQLPEGVSYKFGGDVEQMEEAFTSMILMLGLAIALIYMVLAAQFESYIHPFTIMLSLPLSIVGALTALLLTHQTLSIISIIGIITLLGLVVKNAILLVEFANQLREEGQPMLEAVLEAAPIRLRPILMTTFAMILGMLPMALGVGAGSETRQAMGIAIIGGLITSTVLTLVVVPVVYTLLDRFTLRGKAERARERRVAPVPEAQLLSS